MMTMTTRIREEFAAWIGFVAEAIVTAINRISVKQRIRLIETDRSSFTMRMTSKPGRSVPPDYHFELQDDEAGLALPQAWKAALRGSRLEAILMPSRFLSRPLDLPKRATEFLDAMIRSQIDRLTPWTANEAVFGWTTPVETSNDRINLMVIAAPKAKIDPLIRLAEYCGAGSVILYAAPEGAAATVDGQGATDDRVKLFERHMRGSLDVARVGRILKAVLVAAVVSATLSLAVAGIVGEKLEEQQRQLSGKISERRAALRHDLAASDGSARSVLERRKHETPSDVLVLDALSRILPDHTHVTELRIEKDKLQIVGITQDAPSLVKLIEQSPHFTHATFFAPTTRSVGDPGERFHVEAGIKPYFGLGT
jgi:general secretion pathway protein L